MRSTFNLDDDLLKAVRSLAAARGVPAGQVISELVRKALAPSPAATAGGFPVFLVPAGSPPITTEMVREALEDY